MTNLVIVESPAKCSKIQGFLGAGWRVIASLGHIRHLKEDLDAVGIDRDFEPSFEFMKEKLKAINQIKEAAKGASKIYLASDDDREGELIAYSVALLLKLPTDTTPRAVFHEITKTAVTAAVANPRLLDMNKVNAAQARSMLDMMIGFTISPLLWNAIGPALSAGRCQTPALRLVVDREKEIQEFQSASSWKVHGTWFAGSNPTTALQWPAHLTDELEDEESALAYLENHHQEPHGRILTAETKPWSEQPPLPLITSTLQQQASSLFRVAPKRTMQIAQSLYEAGHITYMRTDKATLSEEAVEAAKEMVKKQYGEAYIGAQGGKKTKKSKAKDDSTGPVTQDAHEAIRPTHFDLVQLPADEDWNAMDRKIYHLIWLKAMQSVMAAARGEQRTINLLADGDAPSEFQWRATWRKTTFEGWRKAATKETTTEEDQQEADNEEQQWQMAAALKPGTGVTWTTMTADPHETKAPPRYTEATLVRELEQKGIGRPSTFASLISTITDKKYVEQRSFEGHQQEITKYTLSKPNTWPPNESKSMVKLGAEKDRLAPTPLGSSVLSFCTKHFDDLFAYGFTAQMESRLDQIAEGDEAWKQVLRDTWAAYKDRYKTLKTAKPTAEGQPLRRKEFGDHIVAVMTKKGPLLLKEDPADKDKTVFYGWPPDHPSIDALTAEQAKAFVAKAAEEKEGKVLGEYEGSPVVLKTGKFGTYATWNGKTTSCQASDSFESIVEKFQTTASKTLRTVGQFEIRNGPYGPYMFKHAITGPSRKFVSVPATVNIEEVNEAQLIAIFQHELQNKARSGQYSKQNGGSGSGSGSGSRGGFRGGFRGGQRGGFRGRGK